MLQLSKKRGRATTKEVIKQGANIHVEGLVYLLKLKVLWFMASLQRI